MAAVGAPEGANDGNDTVGDEVGPIAFVGVSDGTSVTGEMDGRSVVGSVVGFKLGTNVMGASVLGEVDGVADGADGATDDGDCVGGAQAS